MWKKIICPKCGNAIRGCEVKGDVDFSLQGATHRAYCIRCNKWILYKIIEESKGPKA